MPDDDPPPLQPPSATTSSSTRSSSSQSAFSTPPSDRSSSARTKRLPQGSRLELTRQQILAFRRRVGGLDERVPKGPESLRRAAWAGLQDSMPRAALLSLHARVHEAEPSTWEHPSLAQLW